MRSVRPLSESERRLVLTLIVLMQLMVFSKHLMGLPLDEVAGRLRAMDIGGLDLTVRKGGHVEPASAREELPNVAAQLERSGVTIGQITTDITDASDPQTRAILESAAQLGIGYYKLGYYKYEGFGSLRRARDEARARVQDLAQLSAEIGIRGGFHNHSGNFIGANLGDVDIILGDQKQIGWYFDAAHAHIEGGAAGWEMGLDLLSERLAMVAVKDYRWIARGEREYKPQWCPLADGITPWPRVLERLKTIGFDGPISLHSEYQGANSFRDLTTPEVLEQTARDAQVTRDWCAQAGLTL